MTNSYKNNRTNNNENGGERTLMNCRKRNQTRAVPKTIVHNECGGACCFCSNKLPMSLYIYSIEHQSIMAATDVYLYTFSRVCACAAADLLSVDICLSCHVNIIGWRESIHLSYFTRKLLLILSLTELNWTVVVTCGSEDNGELVWDGAGRARGSRLTTFLFVLMT